jgi:beta-glucosidase
MRTLPRIAIAAIAVVSIPAPGRALTPPERRCQVAVAGAGRQLLGRTMAILASCHRALARGAPSARTDCLADRATRHRRAVAAARSAGRIRHTCTDAAVASLALGGDCSAAEDVSGLIACLETSHGAEAEGLIAVASAGRVPLLVPARRCDAQASRQTRRFALARLRLIQRCKRTPALHDPLPPRTDCSAESHTARRLAGLRARAARKIAADCDAAAQAEASFGAPCKSLATGDELARCLLSAADAATDGAIMAEYRDEGFCGDSSDAIERRIDDLLGQMTLAEKVEQMHGVGFRDHAWRTTDNARLQIPGLGMIDGPRGVSLLAANATAFPVAMARGASWDPALEERVGEAIGAEARARGASVLLAPVLNILRHPRWGRAQETYGEDTFHLGRMGVGFIRGAQRHVIASAKHFAANSIEGTRFQLDVSIDERTLREVYLPHFRMAVEQGHVGSIMAAYNKVNGQHCAENVHLLHDVLKGDWAFQGFVESDWILGTRSTVPSANAGLDIEMPTPVYYGTALADAVAAGKVSEAVIDAAVRRILRAQLCFRLDTDPPVADASQLESPAHLDLALEVARKSIVLLKNDAGALPLDRARLASLVVVGALAASANLGDIGSSNVRPSSAVTPLDGIRARAGGVAVTHVPGPALSASDQAALAAADAAVVVAGLTSADEGEGLIAAGDRESLGLSADQEALIAAVAALNPRTIVVLEGGSAITMPWVNVVAAIVLAWYPGQQGGSAIADVLFGDTNPSGKLPITFPVGEADLPPFDNQSLTVTYDYFHGYRWVDRQGITPLFPLGFGLSYTTFEYSNPTLAPSTLPPGGRVRVTVDVTNTGAVPGDEIVQLYVSYRGSRVERAVQELKAFARLHLEPGETRTVPLEVRSADLAFYDVAAGAWEIEPITYVARVGPSSRSLPLEASFTVGPANRP